MTEPAIHQTLSSKPFLSAEARHFLHSLWDRFERRPVAIVGDDGPRRSLEVERQRLGLGSWIRAMDWRLPPQKFLFRICESGVIAAAPATMFTRRSSSADIFISDFSGALAEDIETFHQQTLQATDLGRMQIALRPRDWSALEPRLQRQGRFMPAPLFDCGYFIFQSAHRMASRGMGPVICLPGVQSRGEAQFWNRLLEYSESYMGLPSGALRVLLMISAHSSPLRFEEILFDLREHGAGFCALRERYLSSTLHHICRQRNAHAVLLKDLTDSVLSDGPRNGGQSAGRANANIESATGKVVCKVAFRQDPN